jgi:thioredoxin 1
MSKYQIAKEEFNNLLKEEGVVIADFSSPYCAPCKKIPPVFEEVEQIIDSKAKFIEINVAEENELALEHDVFSVPTIIIFKNGEEKERHTGVINSKKLNSMINNHL